MSCEVGWRHASDLVLLWLWRRPPAIAPIWPLAWEPPYANGVTLKILKNKTKQTTTTTTKKKKQQLSDCTILAPTSEHGQYPEQAPDEVCLLRQFAHFPSTGHWWPKFPRLSKSGLVCSYVQVLVLLTFLKQNLQLPRAISGPTLATHSTSFHHHIVNSAKWCLYMDSSPGWRSRVSNGYYCHHGLRARPDNEVRSAGFGGWGSGFELHTFTY